MPKHSGSFICELEAEDAYDALLSYFTQVGFRVVQSIKPTNFTLERGGVWSSHDWGSKKCRLMVGFSKTSGGKILVQYTYDIHWACDKGKKDTENMNTEIEGLKNFLEMSTSEEKDRICVKCKKKIPWDANFCPYCAYDYRTSKTHGKSPGV